MVLVVVGAQRRAVPGGLGGHVAGLVLPGDVRGRARETSVSAGWTYLVATHLGTAFLLALFVLLGAGCGSLDFEPPATRRTAAAGRGVLFVLALVGFGTKAGFMPLHVWLPEAHPAAPRHVSAVMSGVMIKTGIYGLLRVADVPRAAAGRGGAGRCSAIGAVSGILGVLFALAQHDLKRLLAYHSVENIGIIALGLGVGPAGAELRHAGAGRAGLRRRAAARAEPRALQGPAVPRRRARSLHATGTREIDRLGGLLKRMPRDRRDLPGRRGRDLRPAAAERLRQRVPDLPRRLRALRRRPAPARGRAGVVVVIARWR